MRRKRFSLEQMVAVLKQAEVGVPTGGLSDSEESRRTEVVWLCCRVRENRGIKNRIKTNTINRANTTINRTCSAGRGR